MTSRSVGSRKRLGFERRDSMKYEDLYVDGVLDTLVLRSCAYDQYIETDYYEADGAKVGEPDEGDFARSFDRNADSMRAQEKKLNEHLSPTFSPGKFHPSRNFYERKRTLRLLDSAEASMDKSQNILNVRFMSILRLLTVFTGLCFSYSLRRSRLEVSVQRYISAGFKLKSS